MNVIFPESESVPFVPLEHFVMNAYLFSYVFTYPYNVYNLMDILYVTFILYMP